MNCQGLLLDMRARGYRGAGTVAMAGDNARCVVAAIFRVKKPDSIAMSDDWVTRVTCCEEFRFPRRWRWDVKIQERAADLHGPAEILF